jgi:hypothetical protein
MGFPLEVGGVGKKNIIGRIHIKNADNVDIKTKIDYMDGKISKS